MVQLESSLLTSCNLPGAGRAIRARSSDSSPLKSPTMKKALLDVMAMRLSPKTRWSAASTSACVGGGSLGMGVAEAAGEGCGVETGMGFSKWAWFAALLLHPGSAARAVTAKERRTRKKNFARLMHLD